MRLLEKAISTVAPHSCLNCGHEGKLICNLCRNDVCYTVPSRCYMCKAATENFAVCEKCKPRTALRHVWVASEFKDLVKELIHHFKFERAQAASYTIAQFLKERLPYLEDLLIVPVPTANSRVRLRGYDHAKLLAKDLAAITNLPYLSALSRVGQSRQVGAKRQERTKQLKGAFRLVDPLAVQNAKILLVDDVTTTGATLNEAARTIKLNSVKSFVFKSNITTLIIPKLWLVALAILDDLLRLAGLVAVVFIIWGGIKYMISRGQPENTKSAINTITNALIGLAIAMVGAAVVGFVGNKLG